jgi:hypothetical protein
MEPGKMDAAAEARENGAAGGLRNAAGQGLEMAADVLHRAGHLAGRRGGPAARTADAAHRLGSSLEGAAEYVNAIDTAGLRRNLEDGVRRHPLRSLLIAVGAGYLVGRLLR